jgi:hypothetical protein
MQIEHIRDQVKVILDRADAGLEEIAAQPRLVSMNKREHEMTQLGKMLELLCSANKAILALLDMAVAEEAAANMPIVDATRPASVGLVLDLDPSRRVELDVGNRDEGGIDSTPDGG